MSTGLSWERKHRPGEWCSGPYGRRGRGTRGSFGTNGPGRDRTDGFVAAETGGEPLLIAREHAPAGLAAAARFRVVGVDDTPYSYPPAEPVLYPVSGAGFIPFVAPAP